MFNCYRRRKCCCFNNQQNNYNNEMYEQACNNINTLDDYYNKPSCECGFDEPDENVFPANPMLAQSYVPIQKLDKTFKPCIGLKMGTIFPELVSPYRPNQSVEEIQYIEDTNSIGKGCNKC